MEEEEDPGGGMETQRVQSGQDSKIKNKNKKDLENLPKLWPTLNFCAVLGSHGNQFAGVFILSAEPAE